MTKSTMDARVLELREAGMTNNQVGEMIGLRGTQVASRVRELRAWSAASSTGNLESRSASDIARGPAVRRCHAELSLVREVLRGDGRKLDRQRRRLDGKSGPGKDGAERTR